MFFPAADWPQNAQCAAHFNEFLDGYRLSQESVRIKFLNPRSDRRFELFSVGYIDGFTKILIMTSILCFIHELDTWLVWLLSALAILELWE